MNGDRERLEGVVRLARELLGLNTDGLIACAMISALKEAEHDTLADLIDTFTDIWHDLEDHVPTGFDDGAATDRAYDHLKDNQMGVL